VEPFATYLKFGENGVIPIPRFSERLTLGVPVNAFSGAFPVSYTPLEIIVTGEDKQLLVGGDFTYSSSVSIDKWR
jgi:hypothetical protein